jgi:hypothetical protein
LLIPYAREIFSTTQRLKFQVLIFVIPFCNTLDALFPSSVIKTPSTNRRIPKGFIYQQREEAEKILDMLSPSHVFGCKDDLLLVKVGFAFRYLMG